MNRNNIWIHVGIAVVLITLAAVLGQIRIWENTLLANKSTTTDRTDPRSGEREPQHVFISGRGSEPEILVRFKPGVSLGDIKRIAATQNDKIEDEIESVRGLVSIDDLDNWIDASDTAKQYSAMSDFVEYAEPNNVIDIDPIDSSSSKDLVHRTNSAAPNDPKFAEQWSLNNLGQDGG